MLQLWKLFDEIKSEKDMKGQVEKEGNMQM